MRRQKSLRIGVHHADAVVWEPVYRTRLMLRVQREAPRVDVATASALAPEQIVAVIEIAL